MTFSPSTLINILIYIFLVRGCSRGHHYRSLSDTGDCTWRNRKIYVGLFSCVWSSEVTISRW